MSGAAPVDFVGLRRDQGKTLKEKAEEIGVTVAALQRAEKGTVPTPGNAKAIAEHYGFTVSQAWPLEEAKAGVE
ncbi:MAG TPA: helix-turn-helix transcriptional regulator [Solirubrobacterales bacterium]|nr:helix-turn-helix transcriptional regulator [Solirubrobacterales bacterium]